MAGSDDKYGVAYSDLIDLFAGKISDEKRVALARAIYDPEHPLSYLARRSTKDQPFISEWPPADIPPEILAILDTNSNDDDDRIDQDSEIATSAYADIQDYLMWERERLEDSLVSMLPDDQRSESELVYRSGKAVAWSVLQPFLPRLREIVAKEWAWPTRDAANEFSNDSEVAVGLAAFLVDYSQELPFAPAALACALVRLGLGRLCQ